MAEQSVTMKQRVLDYIEHAQPVYQDRYIAEALPEVPDLPAILCALQDEGCIGRDAHGGWIIAPQSILRELAAFLAQRVETDGPECAAVAEADVQVLFRLLRLVIKAKWAPDMDKSAPVSVRLTDLTRYWHSVFEDLPRYEDDPAGDPDGRVLRILSRNVHVAAEALDLYTRLMRLAREDKEPHHGA